MVEQGDQALSKLNVLKAVAQRQQVGVLVNVGLADFDHRLQERRGPLRVAVGQIEHLD